MNDKNPKDFIKSVAAACKGARARELIADWLPGGVVEGDEWSVLNPTRKDGKRGSFKINRNSGAWSDFATSEGGGDLVSLYKYLNKSDTMLEAAKAVADIIGHDNPFSASSVRAPRAAPKVPPPPKEYEIYRHPKLGVPSEAYVFRRAPRADGTKGDVVVVECVWRKSEMGRNGKPWKEVRPFNWELHLMEQVPWNLPLNDRPLYNLADILASATAGTPLLFVEGAKTALFLKRLLATEYGADISGHPFIPSTWSGGRAAKRISECDWTPIRGRRTYIAPDCDAPGQKTGVYVSDKCVQQGAVEIQILDPGNRPRGWDLANYKETQDGAWKGFWNDLKETGLNPADYRVRKSVNEVAGLIEDGTLKPKIRPFIALGFDDPEDRQVPSFYFYSALTERIVKIGPKDFGEKMLLQLARYTYWQKTYFGGDDGRGGINWNMAGNQVMEECARMGVIDMADMRYGRGCWRVGDDIIIHAGDRLLKDGKWLRPMEASIITGPYRERKLFEAEKTMDLEEAVPAEKEDIDTIIKMAERMSFRAGKLAAHLLVGWSVASVFCGVFNWRPHICLTGAPSSGKTTAMRDIASVIMGDWAIGVEGATTEAGLRRALGISSRPTRFDELEASEVRGDKRQEKILRLARSASTESGGRIRHGDSRSYLIRTMMMANAVNMNLTEEADRQRWFVLEMLSNSGKTRKEQIEWKSEHQALLHSLPDDLWARIFWLVYSRRKAFLSALQSFQSAGTSHFGTMRMGEQVAPVMAALYILLEATDDTKSVSVSEALDFIGRYSTWDIIFEDSRASDFEEMLGFLLSVRMESGITIGYALGQLAEYHLHDKAIDPGLHRLAFKSPGKDGDEPMPEWHLEFEKEIGTYGFAFQKFALGEGAGSAAQVIISSTTCSPLDKQLSTSRWGVAKTRRDVIRQDNRTKNLPQPHYFRGWGMSTRAAAVKWEVIRGAEPRVADPAKPAKPAEPAKSDFDEYDDFGANYP